MENFKKLVKKQEEIGQQILKLQENTKKDPKNRKTNDYFESRFGTLESYWNAAQENHKKIETFNLEHSYFSSDYIGQIQRAYEDVKKFLEEAQKKTFQASKVEAQNPSQNRNKKLKHKMQQLKRLITKCHNELEANKSQGTYERRLDEIRKAWDDIFTLQEEICIDEENSEDDDEEYEALEEDYGNIYDLLKEKVRKMSSVNISTPRIPLPQVKIPVFSGAYEEWPTFHDLFQKIVHENPSLSAIEKMQYLKTYTKEEPSRIIQHLQVSEANYEAAWKLLKNRYQNNRLLLSKLGYKILNLPVIQQESATKLKILHDTTSECLEAINNLGIETASWGPLVSLIITSKWDPETNRIYEQSLQKPNEIQPFEELMNFLKTRFQSLEAMGEDKRSYDVKKKFQNCKFCGQNHTIVNCGKFKELTIEERRRIVEEKKLCHNCLWQHGGRCLNQSRCQICNFPHNTLLHVVKVQHQQQSPSMNRSVTNNKQQTKQQRVTSNIGRSNQSAFLATAMIKVRNSYGSFEYLRALVDPGSESSFITEEACQLLALPKQPIRAEITGLGDSKPKISRGKIMAQLSPRFSSTFKLNTELLVLPRLTENLPEKPLDLNIGKLENCVVADPTCNKPGPIDIILGIQEYGEILLDGLEKTEDGLLIQNTEFGCILSGLAKNAEQTNVNVRSMVTRTQEDEQLAKFWEIEEVSTPKTLTQEEEICEEHFEKFTKRNEDGTYTVQIPFKENKEELGDSHPRAAARLIQLEKRLEKDKKLNEDYKKFMKEYIEMGHMVKIPKAQKLKGKYYIPHQPVLREESTTTKLRVVFDASCKTSTGISLNDTMYVGPRIQSPLWDTLVRWRTHEVAFTADIEKMYRQIKIHETDRPYQRILWRWDPKKPMDEYELTTVTYGTASAPYLAVRTLKKLAADEEKKYPNASKILKRDFYVDDVLSGAESVEEAMKIEDELIKLLESGGFTLRKWSSNKEELVNNLPERLRDQSTIEIKQDETKKSLGIHWAPYDDTIRFKVQLSSAKETITKRIILAETARIYDPTGWLAPIIVRAKLLMQELWIENLSWDDPVPEKIKDRWIVFRNKLKQIEEIVLPRWTSQKKHSKLELHGFCDASEKAYGAVVYIKTQNQEKSVVTLITAKSKVAPIKSKITLPRLELCAAELLAKLMKMVITAMELDAKIYLWTDSMITLSWIKGNPTKWNTFVGNRVAEIQKLSSVQSWRHVRTEENPADVVSRGIDPSKLKELSIWWNGPQWLQTEEYKDKQEEIEIPITTLEEKRSCYKVTIAKNQEEIWDRFSSFSRMIRVIAYCRRFINYCQKKEKQTGPLSTSELESALKQIVRQVQHTSPTIAQPGAADLTTSKARKPRHQLQPKPPPRKMVQKGKP